MKSDASQATPGCSEANGLKLGEFLFYKDDKGILRCLRHGQVWRDFLGDHAVTALFNHAISVAQSEKASSGWVPIGERLPDLDTPVFVAGLAYNKPDGERWYKVARRLPHKHEFGDWWTDETEEALFSPTHWKPIEELEAVVPSAGVAIDELEAAQFLNDGFSIKVLNPERGTYWRCPHCDMADYDGHEQSCVIRVLVERLLGRVVAFGTMPVAPAGVALNGTAAQEIGDQALDALNRMQSLLMMDDGRHPRDVLRTFIQVCVRSAPPSATDRGAVQK
jgi:hypothetical protein